MMNKKILIALPNDMLGGAEQYLRMLAIFYAKEQCNVYVYFITAERYEGWSDLKEIKNIELVFGRGNNERHGVLSFINSLIRSRKNITFDLAFSSHTHITGAIGVLRRLRMIKIRKFVGRESTSIFKRFSGLKLAFFSLFYKLGYNQLDLLICQTEFMKDQFVKGVPNVAGKLNIKVFHNPIDLPNASLTTTADDEKILMLANRYIVTAGRLISEKGYDILIKAFSEVVIKHPEINLLILGEGQLRQELQELIDSLSLKDKVFMPGRVKNVYPYFKNAQLCVVSSRIEGFPNVLLQMMSQNSNVVSTLCAGGIENIPQLTVCKPENIDELAFSILNVLQDDEDRKLYKFQIYSEYLANNSLEKFVGKVEAAVS